LKSICNVSKFYFCLKDPNYSQLFINLTKVRNKNVNMPVEPSKTAFISNVIMEYRINI
ncbi:hypothetical protein T4C_2575, partial [Trichinella pseudospiralis]